MFLVGPLALAAAPAIISGIAGFFGSRSANKTNQREADKNRRFQSAEAQTNRSFQEQMSNTEWQRGIADMTAAGINPAVAYARGGASAPSGAMAGGSQAAPASDNVSSAIAALAQRKQLQLLDSQIRKTDEETKGIRYDARVKGNEADISTAKYLYYFDNNGNARQSLLDLMEADQNASMANSARSISDARLSQLSVPEREAMAKLFEQVGTGGKGMQIIMPLLMQLLRR